MTAVRVAARGSVGSGDGAPSAVRLRPAAVRRRPVVAALSLVVVLVSAAVVGTAFAAAGHTTPVLVVTRTVAVGSPVGPADLGVVSVHVPGGVRTVAATAEEQVVGRAAAQRLVPGTLLATGDLTTGGAVPPGDALVGVALTGAQFPVGALRPGIHVDVVETASPGSPAALAPGATGQPTGASPLSQAGAPLPAVEAVVVADASVLAVGDAGASGSGSTTAVTIVVPVADAPLVAQLSAAGLAAVIAVAAGS